MINFLIKISREYLDTHKELSETEIRWLLGNCTNVIHFTLLRILQRQKIVMPAIANNITLYNALANHYGLFQNPSQVEVLIRRSVAWDVLSHRHYGELLANHEEISSIVEDVANIFGNLATV